MANEVVTGLEAIGRIARALVGGGALNELSERALSEMRDALGLAIAVLYLPTAGDLPILERYVASAGETSARARKEISFDEEGWRLAVAGGRPLIFQEEGSWLAANPFEPPASSWMALSLVSGGQVIGVVMAAGRRRISLDPVSSMVVALVGDLLTAGIANARLRQVVHRTELQRERLRLAADIHDGLAQDLALATREIALLDSETSSEVRSASWSRLRDAIASANRVVRTQLAELSAFGPLHEAAEEREQRWGRSSDQKVVVELGSSGLTIDSSPELTAAAAHVLREAIANIEKHADASNIRVRLQLEDDWLTMIIEDDGQGFDLSDEDVAEKGHLGLALMRERASSVGGNLSVEPGSQGGTRVTLQIPA